jgi:polyhydroxyalkanoate synthesis regulator phasin
MFKKLKDNIGLVATAIALMGSVGAGLSTAADIVNTLQGIDDRMNNIEYEFQSLKEETMVSNDIAVLYEKIYDLENAAANLGRANEQIAYLQSEINNLRVAVDNSSWDLDNKYVPEKWEWDNLGDQVIRLEAQVMSLQNSLWKLDDYGNRIAWLESNR